MLYYSNSVEKDFDEWNEIKKGINGSLLGTRFFCHERDIWWCSLGVNIGIEADGKNETFERPVLILRVFNKDMIWVLPITSSKKQSAFYHPFVFKGEDQLIMLSQIKTISTKRLKRKVGVLAEADFLAVLEKVSLLIKQANENPPNGG